jgi:RNA polymerase sigma-70 factor (ECF subfamily)
MAQPAAADPREDQLIEAAKAGDEAAFGELMSDNRTGLQAHCYRMLGSTHDAEDALQEAMLRAWRAIGRFEGRSSLRSWLYKIATNTCLDIIGRRPKRVLPPGHVGASGPDDVPGRPEVESVWIEPFPDETLALEDGLAGPEARYEQREAVELAFIAALQHLAPNQRAVLILREVLGFSANEVSESLDTSVASVNSALQRARATVEQRLPERTQQETLRTLGDQRVREIVEGYMDAMERCDVDAVLSMLTEDAAWSMPPMATWWSGRSDLEAWLGRWPLSGEWKWAHVASRANGQPAVGSYTWDEESGAYLPFALDVLTLRDDKISEVTSFITRSMETDDEEALEGRWPEQEMDERALSGVFERFGLPDRISA